MRLFILFNLVLISFYAQAQRQREITDFKEKWKLDVSDMTTLSINGLPGNLKILGTKQNELDIKVEGKDTYLLHGGSTGLGFILSKDKRGYYRIQGIGNSSRQLEVTYQIQMPESVRLKMKFGNRPKDNGEWHIENMKSSIELIKLTGDIKLNKIAGPLVISNQNGGVQAHFEQLALDKPHSIMASQKIALDIPQDTKITLEIHLHQENTINSSKELQGSSKLSEGETKLPQGIYTYKLNGGGEIFQIHAFNQSLSLNFFK